MSNELEIRTYPGRPIGPSDDIVVSQEKLNAYILAEVLKAKPEKWEQDGNALHKQYVLGRNLALDAYESSLIVRFGTTSGASASSSEAQSE